VIVDLSRFLRQQHTVWESLDGELRRYETDRLFRPALEDSLRLFDLYERCVADLGHLQEASQPELTAYLSSIVARAYAQIHSHQGRRRFKPKQWLFETLPNTFRARIRPFLLALLLTAVGCGLGATLMGVDKNARQTLMPFQGLLNDPAKRVQQEENAHGKELSGVKATFSATLMANNVKVAIFALACGMTFGFGTILILLGNGIMLGAVAFDYVHAGEAQFLLGWLLPHGVVEIPAILVAGQAGLLLASALIGWHSRQRRSERLRSVAGDVTTLAAGAMVMLIWAGIVEAYVSQYHQPVLPYSVKIIFGVVELVALTVYFSRASRKTAHSSQERFG
jgi:uncharacterized membrane protein SpoIIM required for sporulation